MQARETCGLVVLGTCFLLGLSTLKTQVGPPRAVAEEKQPPPRVRLAVLIVVDQLRGDLLVRWDRLFGDRGFRRMAREGAWFQNCYYPYGSTFTAAGHASLATGCSPQTHGIIGNEWYDRASGKPVNASSALEERPVPLLTITEDGKEKKPSGSGSPHLLLAPTVADALKEATKGKGKVVALALKERSAVLPGGTRPNACYWMPSKAGSFVTSTYYRARPHAWLEEFNAGKPADRWLGKEWDRLRDDLDYDLHATRDDMPGEGTGYDQGRTFPHPYGDRPTAKYYEAVGNSPSGNTLLVELAMKAIEAEELGKDDIPDLLTLSFSSNDLIGHCWGPDSHELLDATLRTDRDLQKLLLFLDAKVGKGQYAVVLSADHGASPTPEAASLQGHRGGRVLPKVFLRDADAFLQRRYGETSSPTIDALMLHDFYLNRSWMRANDLKQEDVEKELAAWARTQPEVQAAYTRTELVHGMKEDDILGQRVRRSFHPDRSGDVLLVLKPYHFFWDYFKGGTTHGSPHDYDRHVPLLVIGPGVKPGVHQESITPQTAAPLLARFLGIAPPKCSEPPVPVSLFPMR